MWLRKTRLTASWSDTTTTNIYGINDNWQALKKIEWYAFYMLFKVLRRRRQKHPINQVKFGALWETFCEAAVCHGGDLEVRTMLI